MYFISSFKLTIYPSQITRAGLAHSFDIHFSSPVKKCTLFLKNISVNHTFLDDIISMLFGSFSVLII